MFTAHSRLPVLLAFLAAVAFSAPACAQAVWRDYPGARSIDAQRQAYDYGYRRGEDRGRDDATHSRAFDYARDKQYRRADDGYNRRYGDLNWYRDEFRRGFVAGYTRGYQAYAPRGYYDNRTYGNRYPGDDGRAVPRPYAPYDSRVNFGYNKGYNDGFEKGRDDIRHNRRYDPQRQNWYRDADRGYKREYGPRSDYAVTYRQGFLSGYGAGYGDRRYPGR